MSPGAPAQDKGLSAPLTANQGSIRTEAYVWYAIVLLALVNLFNFMDRMALAVMLPSIKAELHLADWQLGLLVGLAFSLFYAVCGIPIARLADRGNRRNIMAFCLGVWSVMTALCGVAQNYWQLFLARVGVGIGEAGGLAPAQSTICDYVPLNRRPGFMAIHGFGGVLGIALGMSLAGWLNDMIGWRWTFLVLGLPGALLAVVVRLTLREPKRGVFDVNASEVEPQASIAETLRELLKSSTFRWLSCYAVVNGAAQYGLNQWWPSFYVRVFDLSSTTVGVYLGLGVACGSGAGLLVGGLLANKAADKDARLPLRLGAASKLIGAGFTLGALFTPSPSLSLILVAMAGFCWTLATGAMLTALYSVAPPRMRVTGGAINILLTSALGISLGPFLVGVLSDAFTPAMQHNALRYAMLLPVVLLPLSAASLWFASSSLREDLLVTARPASRA